MSLNLKYEKILNFYKFQAGLYDLTRWTFLFGRNNIAAFQDIQPGDNILEIGTGTGSILKHIEENHNNIDLTGIDISEEMLEIAGKKLNNSKLINEYIENFETGRKFDIIIMSYSLSIIKTNHYKILNKIRNLLKNNGKIFIVDFYDSNRIYKNFMLKKDIFITPDDLKILNRLFKNKKIQVKNAYLGFWKYYIFEGVK